MTPPEELRAAVTVLRCRHVFSVFSADNVRPACRRCGIPYKRHEVVSAEVAEPLARVLEAAAELYEFGLEGCSPDLREYLEPKVRATVEAELVVARVINPTTAPAVTA